MQYRTLIKRVLHKSVDAKPRPQYDYGPFEVYVQQNG